MRRSFWLGFAFLFVLTGCSKGCGHDPRHGHRQADARARRAPEAPPNVEAVLARHRVAWDPSVRAEALEEGRGAIERFDCMRCHTIDAIPPAPAAAQCTGCHARLEGLAPDSAEYRALAAEVGAPTVERFREHIEHFVEVPDLTRIGDRIRAAWIADFVLQPHDLRPMMDESMVRSAVMPKDVMMLARYFAAVAGTPDPAASDDPPVLGPRPDDSDIARGAALFRELDCNDCHTLGNIDTGETVAELRAVGMPARLAPNLRFARERMHRDVLEAWIRAPRAIHPTSHMPDLHVGAEDAARLADFILFVDPGLGIAPKPPTLDDLPPALTRPVGWAEVNARVFARSCVPCHMNDHERDPGPGNTGGFGWHAEYLQMRTYEGLVTGAGSGEYAFSVLVPRPGESMPPVLEHMMLRRIENLRDHIPPFADHRPLEHDQGEPGMPMAMPALSDEEIGLVRAWIEQGCPGPTAVTGVAGVTDGYLVPDGPIAVNRGCERRDPAVVRPAWAVAAASPDRAAAPQPTRPRAATP